MQRGPPDFETFSTPSPWCLRVRAAARACLRHGVCFKNPKRRGCADARAPRAAVPSDLRSLPAAPQALASGVLTRTARRALRRVFRRPRSAPTRRCSRRRAPSPPQRRRAPRSGRPPRRAAPRAHAGRRARRAAVSMRAPRRPRGINHHRTRCGFEPKQRASRTAPIGARAALAALCGWLLFRRATPSRPS